MTSRSSASEKIYERASTPLSVSMPLHAMVRLQTTADQLGISRSEAVRRACELWVTQQGFVSENKGTMNSEG